MGLVRFFGKQFVLTLVILALLWLLLSGQAAPFLSAAGSVAAAGPLGFAAIGLLAFSPVLAVLWFGLLRQEGRPGRPGVAPSRVDHAWDLTGTLLTAAVFLLTVIDSLAAPSGWHRSAMDILTMGGQIHVGLAELAALAVALGPLMAGTLLLQLTATLTRDATPERSPGRAWVWAVAGLLVVAGSLLAAVLAG